MQTLEYANSELNKYYAKVVGGACGIRLKNAASGHPFDDRITIDVEKGKGPSRAATNGPFSSASINFFTSSAAVLSGPEKTGKFSSEDRRKIVT